MTRKGLAQSGLNKENKIYCGQKYVSLPINYAE